MCKQGPKVIKIVGILAFISMINTPSERLKAKNFCICRYFSFHEQLKFRAQLSMKKFYNLGARLPLERQSGTVNLLSSINRRSDS